MSRFKDMLKGGDLRSIGKVAAVIEQVTGQRTFDELFSELFDADRKVVMRAADAIEKITLHKTEYLRPHKKDIIALCSNAMDIELKWHLALLVSRIDLTKKEVADIWEILMTWATDTRESKIVRVNSLQGLHAILQGNEEKRNDFNRTLKKVEGENIPSINARIKKLRKDDR